MLDHKAEAARLMDVKDAVSRGLTHLELQGLVAMSQVHATLYAGEQTARLADALERFALAPLPIEIMNAGDLR